MVDPTGEIAILTCVLIGAGIGLLLGGATGAKQNHVAKRQAMLPWPQSGRWKRIFHDFHRKK
jgi:hypothetical protein